MWSETGSLCVCVWGGGEGGKFGNAGFMTTERTNMAVLLEACKNE